MSKVMMLNENSRKSATKLLLVNWSRFSNVSIALEGSTLFTGVNGSGKSTVLDAITYMLTGNTQFNKAAQDRDRNVVSYVRGDTKRERADLSARERLLPILRWNSGHLWKNNFLWSVYV